MDGEAAVGEEVRRVREDHIYRVFRELGKDVEAVCLIELEVCFFENLSQK